MNNCSKILSVENTAILPSPEHKGGVLVTRYPDHQTIITIAIPNDDHGEYVIQFDNGEVTVKPDIYCGNSHDVESVTFTKNRGIEYQGNNLKIFSSKEERNKAICDMSIQGKTQTVIAKIVGVSQPTVSYVLRKEKAKDKE